MHGMLPNQSALLVLLQAGAIVLTEWGLLLLPNTHEGEVDVFYGGKPVGSFSLSTYGIQKLDQHPSVVTIWNDIQNGERQAGGREVVEAIAVLLAKGEGAIDG